MSSSPLPSGNSPTEELAKLSLSGSAPASGGSGEDGGPHMNGEASTEEPQLTLRALVSTKEAGVIIGKGGANVAELRERSGVKAGVSKVIPGVHDRVLSVTGSLEGIAKVRARLFS
jgi:heterogeneous nuclear rnp K-like protein 2